MLGTDRASLPLNGTGLEEALPRSGLLHGLFGRIEHLDQGERPEFGQQLRRLLWLLLNLRSSRRWWRWREGGVRETDRENRRFLVRHEALRGLEQVCEARELGDPRVNDRVRLEWEWSSLLSPDQRGRDDNRRRLGSGPTCTAAASGPLYHLAHERNRVRVHDARATLLDGEPYDEVSPEVQPRRRAPTPALVECEPVNRPAGEGLGADCLADTHDLDQFLGLAPGAKAQG